MTNHEIIELLRNGLDKAKARSTWEKGIKAYAGEMLDELQVLEDEHNDIRISNYADFCKELFFDAENWFQLATCGEAPTLVSNHEIKERLLTASEKKKANNIDCAKLQARALEQAANILKSIYKSVIK
jgi:hypothetical protein